MDWWCVSVFTCSGCRSARLQFGEAAGTPVWEAERCTGVEWGQMQNVFQFSISLRGCYI